MNTEKVEAIYWCILGCVLVVSFSAVVVIGYAIEQGVII